MRTLAGTVAVAVLLAAPAACTSEPPARADNSTEICARAGELTQPDAEVSRKVTEAFQSSDPTLKQAADEAMAEMRRDGQSRWSPWRSRRPTRS